MKENLTKGSDNFSLSVTYNNPPKDGLRRYVQDSPAYHWEDSFNSKRPEITEYLRGEFYDVRPDGGEYVASRVKGLDIGFPSKVIARASPFKGGITCNGDDLNLVGTGILENAVEIISGLETMVAPYGNGDYGLSRKADIYFKQPRFLSKNGFCIESLKDALQSQGYFPDSLELYGEGRVGKRKEAKFNYWDDAVVSAFDERDALRSRCAWIKVRFKR